MCDIGYESPGYRVIAAVTRDDCELVLVCVRALGFGDRECLFGFAAPGLRSTVCETDIPRDLLSRSEPHSGLLEQSNCNVAAALRKSTSAQASVTTTVTCYKIYCVYTQYLSTY